MALTLRALNKSFGAERVVKDLDLEVNAGEFVTLLGSSGSGKTTTLMMVAGLEDADSGDVVVGDSSVVNLPARKRNFGFVFQQYLLFPHLTALQNVVFPLRVRGVDRAAQRNRGMEMLELVGLAEMADKRPAQLSGGQQQRISLARSLVFNPPVMLMDEPLGALDKNLREQLQTEIKRIQLQLGITVLFVTHDQGEALAMSDRVAVMRAGRIEQLGSPRELHDQPRSVFVAGFLGSMNFFDGKVGETAGGEVAVTLSSGQTVSLPAQGTAGQHVQVAVRPDQLVLDPQSGPALSTGRVELVTYLGTMTRIHVLSPASGLRIEVDLPSPASVGVGDEVTVCARPGATRVFDKESGHVLPGVPGE